MCIFAVPFERRGKLIELLEDKSTSKYFYCSNSKRASVDSFESIPKPEK